MSADDSKSSRQAEHWQQKYYDSLDHLEQQQRGWRELEKQLRLLISRLSLLAEADNPSLVRQLGKLRNQMRDAADLQRIQPLINDISTAIASTGETASTPRARQNPAAGLLLLLDEIDVPRGLERQARHVRRKLEKLADASALNEAVLDMRELLGLLTGAADKHATVDEQAPQQTDRERPGLLSRLFRDKSEAADSTDTSPVEQAIPPPIAQAEHGGEPLAATSTETTAAQQPISAADNAAQRLYHLAGEILIQLLERIDLPDELSAEAQLIRSKLDPCNDAGTLYWGLEASARLLADMQRRVQQDKQELKDFLLQLTERLHELDSDIRETARLREDSLQGSRKLNQAVNSQVLDIENSVRDAVELEALKTAIQSRVIVIRNHVDSFLQREEQGGKAAQTLIQKLQQQLHTAQAEAGQLRNQVEKARQQAHTDSLTGIPNRLAADEFIDNELARFRRYKTLFVLLVCDVDKFKNINDTYGHAAGDKVLKVIAEVMSRSIRETDRLARYGGEEFVAVLPQTSLDEAKVAAEKLRATIETTEFHFRGTRVLITISIGLAEVRAEENATQLFERADAALYQAKENGRNRVEAG